jgi:hypothetical protein
MQEQTSLSAGADAISQAELINLPARHAGKCRVCHHRDRLAIERRFLKWDKPGHIARDHGIKNRASIYRHAHAANLFARRQRRAISAYKAALKQFEIGQGPREALTFAEQRIEIAIRQHLAGSAFAMRDWVRQAMFHTHRRSASAGGAATQLSPSTKKPKSQHCQQDAWISLIPKAGKFLNRGDFSKHILPPSASLSGLSSGLPFLSSPSLCDNMNRFVRPEPNAKRITTNPR